MWGDMSWWNVQGPLLHSGDHIVPRILTVDYTFNILWTEEEVGPNCIIDIIIFFFFEIISSSTSYLEYQAGGGKGLVDLVNQLTLERCHSF